MSQKETIKIDEDVKERLDSLKEEFQYAEPSYSGCIEYLLDAKDKNVRQGADVPESGGDASQEESFPEEAVSESEGDGGGELTAQERVQRVRVDE